MDNPILKCPKIDLTGNGQRVRVDALLETVSEEMNTDNRQKVIRHICQAMINLYLKDHKNGNSLGVL